MIDYWLYGNIFGFRFEDRYIIDGKLRERQLPMIHQKCK